jgi:carbohydrate kinase (thermoresistant glucokinase family)
MTDLTEQTSAGSAPIYVVMGVTGSGKTTIGEKLAARLGIPFHDADDFHSDANMRKLANDIPLNDADREPWLENLARHIAKWSQADGAVLACSALKHAYRSKFRHAAQTIHFIFLTGDPGIIAKRLEERGTEGEHVVKDFHAILEGQFRDLEVPSSALTVDIAQTPEEMVKEIMGKLELRRRTSDR